MYDSLLIYAEWWPHKYLNNHHYKVYFSLLNYSSEIQLRQSQELDDTRVNIYTSRSHRWTWICLCSSDIMFYFPKGHSYQLNYFHKLNNIVPSNTFYEKRVGRPSLASGGWHNAGDI